MKLRKAPVLTIALALALTGCAQQKQAEVRSAQGPSRAQAETPFYVDPDSGPAVWARDNSGDPRAARIRDAIAGKPIARWFGNWSGDVTEAVKKYTGDAATAGKTPVLVAYNITDRDCQGHSGGGAGSSGAYEKWIKAFATGIADRPATVVVEPDAVAQLGCLPGEAQRTRLGLLRYAAAQFKALAPNAKVYLDGGNARWIDPATMATRLNDAGLADVRGFSVNVSNFFATGPSLQYANAVNEQVKAKFSYSRTFVVDTSRNGNGGEEGKWCNPAGAKLGTPSQLGGGAEMLLWLKVPGDSDGPCGTAPGTPAGTFNPDLAVALIDGT